MKAWDDGMLAWVSAQLVEDERRLGAALLAAAKGRAMAERYVRELGDARREWQDAREAYEAALQSALATGEVAAREQAARAALEAALARWAEVLLSFDRGGGR